MKRARPIRNGAKPPPEAEDKNTERLVEALRPMAEKLRRKRLDNRETSTKLALEEAAMLAPMRALCARNDKAWRMGCAMAGVAKRTAENLLALKSFADRKKSLFQAFACLGRTKLYHLARLTDEQLGRIILSKVTGMTDREMLAYLREVAPVSMRKHPTRFTRYLVTLCEMAESHRTFAAMNKRERDGARTKTQELFVKVKKAVKKAM